MTRLHAALLLAATFTAAPAAAQTSGTAPSDSVQRFLAAAADAAERYRDRAVAMREGFRAIGPDFPGMGEHWIQPGRLVSARFRVESPPVLTYAVIDGRPVLTGIAYALPLSARESPPDFPTRAAWHDHAASVDEESLLIAPLAHAAGHGADGGATTSARLSMLHVWLWTPNPDGIFAQENWALPYHRRGLTPPAVVDPDAARALSFLSGGDVYYLALLRTAGSLDDAELSRASALVERLRSEVGELIGMRPAAWCATEEGTRALRARWQLFWGELQGVLSAQSWERVSKFAPAAHAH